MGVIQLRWTFLATIDTPYTPECALYLFLELVSYFYYNLIFGMWYGG